jgi:hypothetical protein
MPEDSRPVLVPADKVDQFAANLLSNREPLVTWQTYSVSRRDRIDRVAARFGMNPWRLAEVNGLSVGSRLYPGQRLLVQAPGQAGNRIDDLEPSTLASLGITSEEPRASVQPASRAGKSIKVAASTAGVKKPTASRQISPARVSKPSAAPKKTMVARAIR